MTGAVKGAVKIAHLRNGLTVLGEPTPWSRSAALGFFVKTGSRDETAEESGVSHFLEHMMFKGTAKRDALRLTYDIGAIGAQANAYTSEEHTVYYATVIPEYVGTMFEILADMLRPALVPEEFDTEKNVILEEIALYEDRPQFYFFERATADYFRGHPAGNSVLGSADSIRALTRDQMADYFGRRYSASNIVLVAAGKFDWDQFVADAEERCGWWPSFEAPREVRPHASPSRNVTFRRKKLAHAHLLYVTEGWGSADDERYAASILSTILGDGGGSKLYWRLVETGKAETAVTDSDERDGTGTFLAYAAAEPERLPEVASVIEEVLSAPLDFTASDLERAKTKMASRVALGAEIPSGRMMSLGSSWLSRGSVTVPDDVIARIKGVEARDVEAVLAARPLRNFSEYRLLPEDE